MYSVLLLQRFWWIVGFALVDLDEHVEDVYLKSAFVVVQNRTELSVSSSTLISKMVFSLLFQLPILNEEIFNSVLLSICVIFMRVVKNYPSEFFTNKRLNEFLTHDSFRSDLIIISPKHFI